jgi:kumamolisin
MAKRQLALSVLALAMIAGSVTASAATKVLTHQGMVGVDESTRLERVPATTRLSLAIGLPLRNQPELAALRQDLHNPVSPNFHHWLTPEEFTAQFGPTQEDYRRLQAWMSAKGLKITQTHANRLVLNVEGSVADIEKAFNLRMHNYQRLASGERFHAPDREPSMDIDVEVSNVHGLNNLLKPVPRLKKADLAADLAAVAHAGSGTGGTYIGKDFRAAYANGVAATLTGTGQGIALFEYSNYYAVDPTNYWKDAGMTAPALTNVGAATANSGNGNNAYFGQDEVSLDIEIAGALAPGAHLYVYAGDDSYTILNKIVSDNLCKQVGVSWGWATNSMTTQTSIDTTEDAIYQQMDAQGISVFVAAGDSGTWTTSQWGQSTSSSSYNPIHPADEPYVTSVGGTNLSTSSADGPWSNETVWSSGGGGYSHRYSIPTWQNGVSWGSISGASTIQRNCPDVSAIASNVYVDSGNGTKGQNFGGTSCAAPLWAAFTALANQYALANGKPVVGFLNPIVYSIGTGSSYATSMHDVKSGSDGLPSATGFDMASGWGTPNGQATINALVGTTIPVNTITASIPTPSSNVTINSGVAQAFTGTATDSSSTATLTYGWNFGDGATATSASASHTYTNTGTAAVTYTATFTATDNTGAVGTATRTITVNPSTTKNTVTASITTPSSNVTIATGTAQAFAGSATDSSTSATLTYGWNFGDGSTATGASASHTYTNSGTTAVTYTATFTATDNTGAVGTATRTITVNPAATGTTYTEVESNNTTSTANVVADTVTKIIGYMNATTDKDYFKVNVKPGKSITVNMTGPSRVDYDLYFLNSSGTTLKSSLGSTATESITYSNTSATATVFYIYVKAYSGSSTTTPYNLALTR